MKVYCLEWEWVRESIFDIRYLKMLIFFQKMTKNHFIFIYLFIYFLQEFEKKQRRIHILQSENSIWWRQTELKIVTLKLYALQ